MGLPGALSKRLRRARPWGTPRDLPWRQARFCVVDIEATGLDLGRDEIVSVGVAEIRNARMTSHTFYEVARPHRPVSQGAMCLHGLSGADLDGAPEFSDVLPRLKAELQDSVIVAHAAWVERAFLNRVLRPLGEQVPERMVDTAALARAQGLATRTDVEPSLEGLSRALRLPVFTPHHALGDARTTAQLLLVLATRLEKSAGDVNVELLLELSKTFGR